MTFKFTTKYHLIPEGTYNGSVGGCCGMSLQIDPRGFAPRHNKDSAQGIHVVNGQYFEEYEDNTHALKHVKTKCGTFTVITQHAYD